MKKIINVIYTLIIVVLLFIQLNVHAEIPTLEQISLSFNNSPTVQEYAQYGTIWKAEKNGEKIIITCSSTGSPTVNYEYLLNGNILSSNITGTEDEILKQIIIATILTDSIGKLHGYDYEETYSTLNSEQMMTYNVEEQGFEIKAISTNSFQVKIDISKKLQLLDFSDTYIKVSDLENLKNYISGDGSAEKRVGNVWFNKSGSNGKNVVLIAEKDNLTTNSYNSLLSILEVMFNSTDVVKYFKGNYYPVFIGDKEIRGIKVEVNPTKTDFEEALIPSDSEFIFVRITIDKNEVKNALNGIKNESLKEKDSQTETKVNVPDTAKNIIIYMIIIGIISFISGITLIIYILKKNKKLSNM